jgi:transcriptional regulator of heat shock response
MEQNKRLGGWQCWVDFYEDYVIKTPKNREEIKEKIEKFLRRKNKIEELDKRTNKMISDIKESTKIIKKSKIPRSELANLEFIGKGKIKQKRVAPLDEFLKKLNEKERFKLIDKIIKFLLKLWSYGIHEKTFKLFSNLGIDEDNIVLIDVFEIATNKSKVLKQIKKKSWEKTENYKKYLSEKEINYLIKKLNKTLTIENLDKYWKTK